MSTTSDDIEIDLDEPDPAKPLEKAKVEAKADDSPTVEVAKVEKPPKKARVNTDEGLEKLKADLANERALREAAEQRANAASAAEVQARTAVQGSQLDLVTNAISQFTSQKAQLEASYAQALTDQDFAAAAKIQGQMVEAQVKLSEMARAKAQMERAPKPAPSVAPDPVEQLAAQLSPKSAEWVRNHPEFARDPAKKRRMERAHEDAVEDGLVPDSAEYFAFVENRLKVSRADAESAQEAYSDAARPTQTRSAPPASAPVSRTGNGTASRTNVVTLTPEQVEMAKLMDMTPQEYARHTLAIKREGMN
jgi:hypothetical protein